MVAYSAFKGPQNKRAALAGLVIASLMLTTSSAASGQALGPTPPRMFGLGAPFAVTDLPPSRLRSDLEALSPASRERALAWLHGFSFPAADANSLRVDRNGGVYYEDRFVAGPRDKPTNSPPASSGTAPSHPVDGAITAELIGSDASNAFVLHSRPGASRVVYLNFRGQDVKGTAWNDTAGRSTLYALPFSLDANYDAVSLQEAYAIAEIWKEVSEDYSTFDIDVTTERPTAFGPQAGHVLITRQFDRFGYAITKCSCSGRAYINVWGSSNFTVYQPALVFYEVLWNDPNWIAETASHELGHNVGLSHDGILPIGPDENEYYGGHGAGLISWAPIMGAPFDRNVTQWSKGEYPLASNKQDDIAQIASKLTYIADDHQATLLSATPIVMSSGTVTSTTPLTELFDGDAFFRDRNNKGIINSSTDTDLFVFDASSAGTIDLTLTPAWRDPFTVNWARGANLDLRASLLDSAGNVIAESNPRTDTSARVIAGVGAGRYFVSVNGVGVGTAADGYSNYASTGQYFITGSIPTGPKPQVLALTSDRVSIGEGTGTVRIPVLRTGKAVGRVSIPFRSVSFLFPAPPDFPNVKGVLELGPGVTSGEISIPILNDGVYEWPESFVLEIGNPTGGQLGTPNQVVIEVLDDEKGVGFQAPNGLLYLGVFNIDAPTAAENAGSANIVVARIGSTGAASVNYTTSNGTALASSDYSTRSGTINWADGDSSPKTILVPILDDTNYERISGTDEYFNVKLSSPVGVSILGSPTVAVWIEENDPPPIVAAQLATLDVAENDKSFTVFFTRSGALDKTITARWWTECWTACTPSDFISAEGTLTFGPGQTLASAKVTLVDDGIGEADETMAVNVWPVTGGEVGEPGGTLVRIRDNDGPSGGSAVVLSSLTLNSNVVVGCKSVAGTVLLSGPAPIGGASVALTDTLAAGSSPATVNVPAGATNASFTFVTSPVGTEQTGDVTASLGTNILSQPLTIRPIEILSLSLTPSTVVGSNSSIGKATLECAAQPGPIVVSLLSDNPAAARPAVASIVVPQGSKSASFSVTSDVVTSKQIAGILATVGNTTKSRSLTVTPAVTVSPSSLKFGTILVNGASPTQNATIANKGTAPFSILDISLSGSGASHFRQSSTCPATLPGGTSCTIGVSFAPSSTGSKSAKLVVKTSASVTTSSISLSGSGALPP